MNSELKLSYVLTTFNKLAYLQITLPLLIEALQPDEEIVVADGGSTDGSAKYLQDLKRAGKIQQFISEKDFGEAHGTNKCFLMARGVLVKLITDDDVFSFKVIRQCREFMLKNPEVDIMGFDGYGHYLANGKFLFQKSRYITGYKEWLKNKTPFLFCGLSFMMRRTSLAYIGLFNTRFKMIDMEYSLRVSSLKANIAFHTAPGFVGIANPDSNSIKFNALIEKERTQVYDMYSPELNRLDSKKIKTRFISFLSSIKNNLVSSSKNKNGISYADIVKESISLLEKESSSKSEILFKL